MHIDEREHHRDVKLNNCYFFEITLGKYVEVSNEGDRVYTIQRGTPDPPK